MNFIKILKNFDSENFVNRIAGEGKLKPYIDTQWNNQMLFSPKLLKGHQQG